MFTHPCIHCRYYELACTHPAVGEFVTNPITGTGKLVPLEAEKARAVDGPCGPEAALFDPRSLPATVLVEMLSSSIGRWVLGIGGLIGLAYLFG